MEAEASSTAQSLPAAGATASSFSGPGTKHLEETFEKGHQTLIDRFYNGGNTAREGVADVLVLVLDSVISRMRQAYATRTKEMEDARAGIQRCEDSIAMVTPHFSKLKKELDEKMAEAAELKKSIAEGQATMKSSVDVAREALQAATLATRGIHKREVEGGRQAAAGYDKRGRALPGREVNLRKNPLGVAARKPGDMLKDLPKK
jgi:hypothetical protein